MGNVIDVDIHIHLDKFHPPDPTGTTDYVALGLIGGYALLTLVGNVALARIAATWPLIEAVNIPLVYAMTFFSLCHLACVYLDMYFWPALSEAIQEYSCVVTAYWGEYLVGLGGFLSVLGVRAFSLMSIAYSRLRPGGPEYRRTLLKCIVFVLMLLPIYSICLLVSVDDDSQFDTALHGCDTPAPYKIALVVVLAGYILVLGVQAAVLATSALNPAQMAPMLSIIGVSVPLLLAACVVHFAYMLPHYWGRLAFVCIACALHTFAYVRITVPGFLEYREYLRSARLSAGLVLDPDNHDEDDDEVMFRHAAPVHKDPHVPARITSEARWLMKTINPSCPRMTTEILMRVDSLREEFFVHCAAMFSSQLFTYTAADALVPLDAFETQTELCIPASRLILFYGEVHAMYVITQTTYSTNAHLNAEAVYNGVAPLLRTLTERYLSATSRTQVNLPASMVARLRRGFKRGALERWDVAVLREIMVQILTTFIDTDDGDYHMLFVTAVEKLLGKSGCTLYTLAEENMITLREHEPAANVVTDIGKWVKLLRAGRAVEMGSPDDDSKKAHALNEGNDPLEFAQSDEVEDMLHAAPVDEVNDQQLDDGAVIYSSPSRALYFFLYDLCACWTWNLPSCFPGNKPAASVHLDAADDEELVVHTVTEPQ